MRKSQKKQAEELLGLLGQVHKGIRQTIQAGKKADAMDLLGQCQDAAINLGEAIEQTEGEGFVTVTYLEEYCELVFQIYEKLQKGQSVHAEKAYKYLHKGLVKVKNSVSSDIKVRTEAVFLPYKASMWDSLESVWKAADKDPDCDAYVIPIPYYDKNPDGSFREEHYEGDQYPDYVPITRYQEYDFAEHCPDLVFIHNPYDEYNYITSVHPFFYSKNLKQYTDQLVYIPYFILGEIDPEDTTAVKGMEHFCTVPGVIHADKVIVQSEAMKKIYVNVLTEFAREAGMPDMDRKYWEGKILGLGSPKVDKVLITRREDLEIPEEWLRIIEKADGSWKKVVFYNTTVTALLQHGEQYLEKMRDVFRVFWENREDITLLWRPHPLMEATVRSMRPELAEEYDRIVAIYREDGWGIYDDTAEIDRAVAVSDGYYGDGSSIAKLCQEAGKPVMIQNVYSLPSNNYSLAMDNIAEHHGEGWFIGLKDQCLYRMNMKTYEAEFVVRIPRRRNIDGVGPVYGKLYFYGDKAFIIPWQPIDIVVYDTKKKEIRYIQYENEIINRGMVFSEGITKDNKLYVIPCSYEYILCLDMNTEKVSHIYLGEILKEKHKQHSFAWGAVYFDKNTIYMTMLFDNKVLGYDLRTNDVKVYQDGLLSNGSGGICGTDDDIWIIPRKTNRIIHWDRKKKTFDFIEDFPIGYQSGEWSFHKIVMCEEYLCLLPRDANMCLLMNKETGKMTCPNLNYRKIDPENYYDKYMMYSNAWEDQRYIFIICSKQGTVFRIDKTENFKSDKICLLNKTDEACSYIQTDKIYELENRFENTEKYIEYIKDKKDMKNIHKTDCLKNTIWSYFSE